MHFDAVKIFDFGMSHQSGKLGEHNLDLLINSNITRCNRMINPLCYYFCAYGLGTCFATLELVIVVARHWSLRLCNNIEIERIQLGARVVLIALSIYSF